VVAMGGLEPHYEDNAFEGCQITLIDLVSITITKILLY